MKLTADDLRKLPEDPGIPLPPKNPIYLITDNIYDTYNIGGLFRLADAISATELIICGQSETPPNHRIKKASIGTYKIVPWRYFADTLSAMKSLREERNDIQILALEQNTTSKNYWEVAYKKPLAIIVGNETSGCSQKTIEACDGVIEIPMWGVNISMNVIVSSGIAVFEVLRQWSKQNNTK